MKCQAETCYCTDFNRKFCKNYTAASKKKGSKGLSKARKPTGEMKLFQQIWDERPHVCFVSGDRLSFSPSVFFHILGKGAYAKYRLERKNILLVSPEYHTDWHTMTRAELLAKNPDWQKVFDLYEELKIQYIKELKEELIAYQPKKK